MNEKTQYQPVNSIWFHTKGSFNDVGIVAGLDTVTGEVKTFIGTASGYNKITDEKYILKTGTDLSCVDITNFTITSNIIAQKILDNNPDD